MTYSHNPSFHARKHINQAQTAIEHFHSPVFQYRTVTHQQALILEHMERNKDYTITELAYLCKMEKSSVSGRRNEMLHSKKIVKGIKRKCKFSEIKCQTVRLP